MAIQKMSISLKFLRKSSWLQKTVDDDSFIFTDAVPVRETLTPNPPWLQIGPDPTTLEEAMNVITSQHDNILSLEEKIENKLTSYSTPVPLF